jgi:Tfp pilus assembly protein PilX
MRRLRDESGIALVMAVGILTVLMVTGATVVFYAGSNARSAEYSADDARALNLAEAGENYARAVLWNAADPTSPTTFSGGPLTLEGGTVTYSGSYDAATKLWTLTGTGTHANPTGATTPISRTVTSQVLVSTTGGLHPAWGYLFADTESCTLLQNNLTIDAPIYVKGDLCMENSAVVTGDIVQVRGNVQIKGTASIGLSGTPVPVVRVGGAGCRYPWSGSYASPCTSSHRVYRSIFYDTVPNLDKPPLELDHWYANANLGPANDPCATLQFDTDGTLNRSNPTQYLLTTTAYTCQTADGLGKLNYTPGTPGTLEIEGVVFFDGPIRLNSNRQVVYTGKGSIYASGVITIENHVTLCGVAACDTTWDPETNLLGLVSGSEADDSFVIENNTTFQGAIYANTDFTQDNSVIVCGPVIAQELEISNNTDNCFVPFGDGVPGLPGSSTPTVTLLNVPDSFYTD